MKLRTQVIALACCTLSIVASAANVKSASEYAVDLKDYVLSPLHWDASDWRWAGGAALSIAAAYTADERIRDHFAKKGVRTTSDPHATRDAAPLAILMVGGFALGKLSDEKSRFKLGMDMGEAVVLGTLSASVFKVAAGRARPNDSDSHSRFRDGGASFPSGHTTAAFAAAQVFADRMPRDQWGWRALAYGLAGATAYARMDSNAHWFSDTVAGAALGIATGRFVSHRGGSEPKVTYWVAPLDHGALLTFNVNMD